MNLNEFIYKIQLLILVVLAVMVLCSTSWATTYYVDATNGNDSNLGTSSDKAWKYLSKVNSMTFEPGDIIRFKRGEVWNEGITLEVNYSGTINNWIVFADYGNGELPKFDYSSNSGEGFYIFNQDYIKIQNIHIYNAYREGISIYGNSSDRIQGFQLIGCYIENNGLRRGAYDFGLDAQYIDDLTISDTIFDGNRQSGTRIQSCRNVIIARCVGKNHVGGDDHDGFLIQNTDGLYMFDCSAHNNSESGIDLGGYEAYTDNMQNAYVHRCFVYDNDDDGIAISGCQIDDSTPFYTRNIYFYNCLSYGNGTYNLKVYENAGELYFYNCLFDNSGSHNLKFDEGAHDLSFRNCIVSNSSGNPVNIWTGGSYPYPYNLDFDFMLWYPKIPQAAYRGTTYWTSDPKFTNPSGDDYTLQSDSPAIDAGTNLGEKYKFGLDPASDMQLVKTLDQDANGNGWEIGPYVYPVQIGELSLSPPSNLRIIQ
jgi:hypothetical protein